MTYTIVDFELTIEIALKSLDYIWIEIRTHLNEKNSYKKKTDYRNGEK